VVTFFVKLNLLTNSGIKRP